MSSSCSENKSLHMRGLLGKKSLFAHEYVEVIPFQPFYLQEWFRDQTIAYEQIPSKYKYHHNRVWLKQIEGEYGIHYKDSAVVRSNSIWHDIDATSMHEGFHILMYMGREELKDYSEYLSTYLLSVISDETIEHIGHGLKMGGYINKSIEQQREEVLAHVFQLHFDEMEQSHQKMLAGVLACILYHRTDYE